MKNLKVRHAEERLDKVSAEMSEAQGKMDKAIQEYADKRVQWAFAALKLSEALDEQPKEETTEG